jgi:protein phosphatase
MTVTIQDIVTLHALGQRARLEDSLYPEAQAISPEDRLFLVCDGVGGVPGGDLASRLACRHFSNYLLQLGDVFQTRQVLADALAHTEERLVEYARSNPEYEGMATTLACLRLTGYGAVVAWVGDSRVIQIREGRIIRQTKDHSLVNVLMDYGEITREQAAVHPKKNVLLRAVSSAATPTKLDVMYIDDIMPGDYFMVCSDGIVEGVGDRLERLFAESFSTEQLKNDIAGLCRENTADNYTMILLRIGAVTEPEAPVDDLEWTLPALKEEAPRSARVDGPDGPPPRRLNPYLILAAIAVLIFVSWWIQRSLPVALQVRLVGESGVLIRDAGRAVLIDAFPLSNKVRENRRLEPVRQSMLEGKKPFNKVELMLVSHRPNVAVDSVESFLRRYLQQNQQVALHPTGLQDQLALGRALFAPVSSAAGSNRTLPWEKDELDGSGPYFVERIPLTAADSLAGEAPFSAFLLHMNNNKSLLYAGDPNVDIDYLAGWETPVNYLLINEWNLRQGAARRTLASRFSDRQLIILPSSRPMNNQQRAAIRAFFPRSEYLSADEPRAVLR